MQHAMQHSKRYAEILRLVREEGTCTIAGLAKRLGVSLETIRRDVRPLTETGELLKMHGAVALPHLVGEAPFERRMRANAAAKKAVARQVARHIADGSSLMLDTGTTTSFIARELLTKKKLTVVTNSSDIARTLATVNENTVYMAGGELNGDNGAAFGPSALSFIERFKVRHAVISISAIDAVIGPMDYTLREAEVARRVLASGSRKIIATDHTKFGRPALVKVCDFADIDLLITDEVPPGEVGDALRDAGAEVEIVNAALNNF